MRDRAAARFSESLRRPLSHLSFVPLECPNHELSHLITNCHICRVGGVVLGNSRRRLST